MRPSAARARARAGAGAARAGGPRRLDRASAANHPHGGREEPEPPPVVQREQQQYGQPAAEGHLGQLDQPRCVPVRQDDQSQYGTGERGPPAQPPVGRGGGDRHQPPEQVPGPDGGAEQDQRAEGEAEGVHRAEFVAAQPEQQPGAECHGQPGPPPERDRVRGHVRADQLQQGPGGPAQGTAHRPVRGRDRGVQGGDPAVPGAGHGGDRHRGPDRHHGGAEQCPDGPPPPGELPGPERCDEHQRDQGGRLHQGGQGQQRGAERRPVGHRRGQPGAEQPHHQSVVVRTADQVDQDQRVEHAEPERRRRVDPAASGQAGQDRGEQDHPEHGDHPQAEDAEDHLGAGHRRHRRGQDQENRAVRGGGVLPDRRHLGGEGTTEGGRTVPVDVQPGADHRPLGQVAVDVAAEDRRRDRQWCRPERQGDDQGRRAGRTLAVDEASQPPPGGDEQAQPERGADQAEARMPAQFAQDGEGVADRQRTGSGGAEGQQDHPGHSQGAAAGEHGESGDRVRHPCTLSATDVPDPTASCPVCDRHASGLDQPLVPVPAREASRQVDSLGLSAN